MPLDIDANQLLSLHQTATSEPSLKFPWLPWLLSSKKRRKFRSVFPAAGAPTSTVATRVGTSGGSAAGPWGCGSPGSAEARASTAAAEIISTTATAAATIGQSSKPAASVCEEGFVRAGGDAASSRSVANARPATAESRKRSSFLAGLDFSPSSVASSDGDPNELAQHLEEERKQPVKRACNECRQQKVHWICRTHANIPA